MDKEYADFLNKLCQENGISDNISFAGFMKTQEQLFREALKAKVTVLPTYHDALPGTVVESMFMKIPVIAYHVGGLPELNTRGNAVILVEKGDIETLAVKITELLNNKEYRKSLGESGYTIIQDMIRPDRIAGDILEAYDRIAPFSGS
jgi:glycosyltransferase involved in cell wall biosynthesis